MMIVMIVAIAVIAIAGLILVSIRLDPFDDDLEYHPDCPCRYCEGKRNGKS